jgi:beta-lactamase regulating signal transducer with metallopeptidase domain
VEWLPRLVMAWLAGVVLLSLRLARRVAMASTLVTTGVQKVRSDVDAMVGRLAERLAIARAVRVVQSSLARVPAVVGWWRPVVVLPASIALGLAAADLEALLAHELAHVRRHDYLVNVLQSVVEVVFFYHPAAWWLSHRVRVEREFCCDDLAIAACGDRLRYASALRHLELLRRVDAMALAATDGSLVARVRRILDGTGRERTQPGWIAAALVALSMVMAVG